MEQQPSVGRVVHYVAYGTPGGEFKAGAHRAAIITEVPPPIGNPGEVDMDPVPAAHLCVVNPTGLFFNLNVPYDGSDHPKPGTWHWPERV